jgi:DNA-binding NarL/FixJ family response regulator
LSEKRVYIVDDHAVIREGIAEFVNHLDDLTVCGAADSAEAALEEIDSVSADLVLVDIALPKMSGIGLVEELRRKPGCAYLAIVSGHSATGYVEQALAAGADGYILKGDPDELERGIRTVLSGERFVSSRLHLKALPSAERVRDAPPVVPLGDGRRVVVIDDNEDAASTLGVLLQTWGNDVTVAFDGTSGVRKALEVRPDIVVIDITLPDIDGNEVARQLRAHPHTRDAMLLAVSGYDQTAQQRGLFDHHFVKPVDMDALEDLLGADAPPVPPPGGATRSVRQTPLRRAAKRSRTRRSTRGPGP